MPDWLYRSIQHFPSVCDPQRRYTRHNAAVVGTISYNLLSVDTDIRHIAWFVCQQPFLCSNIILKLKLHQLTIVHCVKSTSGILVWEIFNDHFKSEARKCGINELVLRLAVGIIASAVLNFKKLVRNCGKDIITWQPTHFPISHRLTLSIDLTLSIARKYLVALAMTAK